MTSPANPPPAATPTAGPLTVARTISFVMPEQRAAVLAFPRFDPTLQTLAGLRTSAQHADLAARWRLAQADVDVETSLVDVGKALGVGRQIGPVVGTASPDGLRLRLHEAPLTWTGPIGGNTIAPPVDGTGRSAPNDRTGPERGMGPDRTTTGTERGDGE